MQCTVVVAFLFCCACFSLSTVSSIISPPIPVLPTEPGIRHLPFDGPPPKVRLEIFVDLNCPYCNNGWAVMKQVQQHYGNNRLDLVVHQFPLIIHRNALLCSQGIYVIQNWNSDQVFSYVEAVLASADQFSTSKTANKTDGQITEDLADVAAKATGIDKDIFIEDIGRHRRYAYVAWKYAAKRDVAATPTYFVNGVYVRVETNSFEEWTSFLDPIINAP